jgi:hypothetical protein
MSSFQHPLVLIYIVLEALSNNFSEMASIPSMKGYLKKPI